MSGDLFMSILEQNQYRPDGTVRPHFRKYLKEQGRTDAEIAEYERLMKEEIEDRKLWAPTPQERRSSLRDKAIARAGLDVEELLSQGYLNVDQIDEIKDIDSFSIEDIL